MTARILATQPARNEPDQDHSLRAVEPRETPLGGPIPTLRVVGGRRSTVVDAGGQWLDAADVAEFRRLKSADRRRKQRREHRKNSTFAQGPRVVSMLGTMLPRLAHHVSLGSINGEDVGQLSQQMASISEDAVRQLRDQGQTWAEIGEAFGMTKQGAQQRWGRNRGIA